MTEEYYMSSAIKQALVAEKHDEVPIGAVIVKDGKIIARAHNTRNASFNATDHAELKAIAIACKKLGDWRLTGCKLYVTLEPCVMCLGACYNARISHVYFGAYDVSGNGCIAIAEMLGTTLNHNLTIHGGVMKEDCERLLTQYFANKRKDVD